MSQAVDARRKYLYLRILRIATGLLFLYSGGMKVYHGIPSFAQTVADYRLLPQALVYPFAAALPFYELALGLWLLTGWGRRLAFSVSAVTFALFATAIALSLDEPRLLSCGCFGLELDAPILGLSLVFDLVMLAAMIVAVGWSRPRSETRRRGDTETQRDGST